MEIIDLHGQKEFSSTHHIHKTLTSTPLTRMVLYRVQAGRDRHTKALDAWPR